MKLFQHDKKVWENGETSHTWQFGIFNNRSLLWVNYETPSGVSYASGGINILVSLLTSTSLLGVDIQDPDNTWSFAVCFFTEYFEGWNDE